MNLLKFKDAVSSHLGQTVLMVICGKNCSRCKKAYAQLFDLPSFQTNAQAAGLNVVFVDGGSGLPAGIQSINFTPYVVHVAITQAGKASKVAGTKPVSFNPDAKGNFTMTGFIAVAG